MNIQNNSFPQTADYIEGGSATVSSASFHNTPRHQEYNAFRELCQKKSRKSPLDSYTTGKASEPLSPFEPYTYGSYTETPKNNVLCNLGFRNEKELTVPSDMSPESPGTGNEGEIVTARPEEAEITTLPEEAEITTLPEEAEITSLPGEAEITTRPEETEITTRPEEAEITTLPDEAVITALPGEEKISSDISCHLPQHMEQTDSGNSLSSKRQEEQQQEESSRERQQRILERRKERRQQLERIRKRAQERRLKRRELVEISMERRATRKKLTEKLLTDKALREHFQDKTFQAKELQSRYYQSGNLQDLHIQSLQMYHTRQLALLTAASGTSEIDMLISILKRELARESHEALTGFTGNMEQKHSQAKLSQAQSERKKKLAEKSQALDLWKKALPFI